MRNKKTGRLQEGPRKLLFRLLKAFPFPGPEEGDSTPSSSSPGKALYALVEVLHLDEKIRNKIENLMCQGLLKLKEEQDKLSALREFQEGIMPSFPSPPIFGEVRLIFSSFRRFICTVMGNLWNCFVGSGSVNIA